MVALKKTVVLAALSSAVWLAGALFANAQVMRYQPARPTVSPYLNLFRPNNGVIPNYQSLVRPMLQQQAINQQQQLFNEQQSQSLQQLQLNMQGMQQQQASGSLVPPTGKSSWFARPSSRHQFMNTSRYFSQSGSAGVR